MYHNCHSGLLRSSCVTTGVRRVRRVDYAHRAGAALCGSRGRGQRPRQPTRSSPSGAPVTRYRSCGISGRREATRSWTASNEKSGASDGSQIASPLPCVCQVGVSANQNAASTPAGLGFGGMAGSKMRSVSPSIMPTGLADRGRRKSLDDHARTADDRRRSRLESLGDNRGRHIASCLGRIGGRSHAASGACVIEDPARLLAAHLHVILPPFVFCIRIQRIAVKGADALVVRPDVPLAITGLGECDG
jgi:hypothetical protein